MDIVVLGGGTWGTALAIHLAQKHSITVWEFSKERVEHVNSTKKHDLMACNIPDTITFTNNISCVKTADLILIVTPSFAVEPITEQIKPLLKETAVLVCASKGLGKDGKTLYEIMKSKLTQRVAVLTGPTHAEEVIHKKLSGALLAAEDAPTKEFLKEVFQTNEFIFDISSDPVGAQLSASVKNVLAIVIGIVNGLGFGDNAEALILTKGFHQLSDVVERHGGTRETYLGLAGLGDVLVTCMSSHSRNRTYGFLLGKGKTPKEAEQEVGMIVEGVNALNILHKLNKQEGIEIPVIDELYKIIYEGKDAREALTHMLRE